MSFSDNLRRLAGELRSGRWVQCSGRLWIKKGDIRCHCASGVALELFCPDHEGLKPQENNERYSAFTFPPSELFEFIPGPVVDLITRLNDGGRSFPQLAERIDRWTA